MFLKIYIAGKVSKVSQFGTHHWRDEFCKKLAELSGYTIRHLDPLAMESNSMSPKEIFNKDCQLINQSEAVVVYLSDDISVGGSQEILIARYLRKPVIGFAPLGGKFNGSIKEMHGEIIKNYKDPFVFSTCDFVAGTLQEVADCLKRVNKFKSVGMKLIDQAIREQI